MFKKYSVYKQQRLNFLNKTNPKSPEFILATWFGTGLIIPASGTWGTIGGMLFGVPLLALTNPITVFITAVIVFLLGLWSINKLEKQTTHHDASFIVIDEVAAILLVLALIPATPIAALWGFVLFRIFDAAKPWPISLADRKINGAFGVMFDDILAAIFTIITYYLGGIIWINWLGN